MAIEAWKHSYFDQLKVIPVKLGKLWLVPAGTDFYTVQKEIRRGLYLDLEVLFSDELWPSRYAKWKRDAYLLIYAYLFIYWVNLVFSVIGYVIKIRKYRF